MHINWLKQTKSESKIRFLKMVNTQQDFKHSKIEKKDRFSIYEHILFLLILMPTWLKKPNSGGRYSVPRKHKKVKKSSVLGRSPFCKIVGPKYK